MFGIEEVRRSNRSGLLVSSLATHTVAIALVLIISGLSTQASPTGTPCPLQPWTLVANYPVVIEAPAVASDGIFAYSAGGFEGELGGISNGFFRYDPVANAWTSLPPIPTAVGAARGVYAANTNSFYVFGGFDRNNALNITQIFNFGTNTWSTGAAMPAPRFFSNLAYDSITGKIFVIGGFHATGVPEDSQTWEYDPVLNTWNTTRANIPVGMGGSATSIAGQFIYLVGTWNNFAASNVHYRYDITGNTWTAMAVAPAPVYEAAGAAIGGQTYVIGGGNPTSPQNSTYVYDIASNTWSTGPNLNVARSFTAGTAIGARLLVVGGGIGGPPPFVTDTVEITQGSCGTPTPTATPGGTPIPTPTPTATATPPATATPGGKRRRRLVSGSSSRSTERKRSRPAGRRVRARGPSTSTPSPTSCPTTSRSRAWARPRRWPTSTASPRLA